MNLPVLSIIVNLRFILVISRNLKIIFFPYNLSLLVYVMFTGKPLDKSKKLPYLQIVDQFLAFIYPNTR
jgi:hypothetical protein